MSEERLKLSESNSIESIIFSNTDEPEPEPTAQQLYVYVMRRWPENRGLTYYHQSNTLMVRLPGGEVVQATVTGEEICAG